MTDEKRIKRFIEGAKKAYKEVDDPTFTFPMNILSAYEFATSIEELLKAQEAVVRCKDCKHYKDGFCYNPNTYDDEKTKGNTVPDWFCADGERR